MKRQTGQKIGWTAGWTGGFIWVAILSVIFLYQQKYQQGVSGVILTVAAVAVIHLIVPWRYPSTPFWKLMLAPYGMFFLSILWAIWAYGGLDSVGLFWWHLLWLLPLLLPFGTMGNKTWADPIAQHNEKPDTGRP